jgi:uncharacterized protein DUF1571
MWWGLGLAAPILWVAAALGPAQRLDQLRAMPPAAFAQELRQTSTDELLRLGREGVRRLGTYRARLTKQERVGGRILPWQTLQIVVQPAPGALRLEYVQGPKAGRIVLWNARRPAEILVREAGLLGIVSVWLDLDGSLARGDTNHRATDLGFGPLLDLVERDVRGAAAAGGHQRHDDGFDAAGHYCLTFTAPPGARGLYAEQTRLCIDPQLGLPVDIEVRDRTGFLERFRYTDVRPHQVVDAALLTTIQ